MKLKHLRLNSDLSLRLSDAPQMPSPGERFPREKALGAAIKQNDKLEFAGWVQVRVYTSKYKIP